MLKDTRAARGLLIVILLGLLMVSGLLYTISLDLAADYPEVAHLRLPIYVAAILGLAAALPGVKAMFTLLALIDHGEAFSIQTVRTLRQLKLIFVATAAYSTVALIVIWVALLPLQSPSLLLGWFAGEVTLLFFFTLTALLERLFATALELRHDNELTV